MGAEFGRSLPRPRRRPNRQILSGRGRICGVSEPSCFLPSADPQDNAKNAISCAEKERAVQSAVAVAGRDTETAARDSGHGATVIKEVKILVVPRGVDGAPKNGRNRAGLPITASE